MIPRLFAIFHTNENAIVSLRGCNDLNCQLHGTYATDPISLNKYIIKEDGSKVFFNINQVTMISLPLPATSKS